MKRKGNQDQEKICQENSPSDLNLNSQVSLDKIRDELNKAMKEGYSQDYEEIRKYTKFFRMKLWKIG